jgi:hypothetical protein
MGDSVRDTESTAEHCVYDLMCEGVRLSQGRGGLAGGDFVELEQDHWMGWKCHPIGEFRS